MARNPSFSSTMRIDLTPGGADATAPAGKQPRTTPVAKGKRKQSARTQLVGSNDFRQLLESVYDAAIITDMDGNIIDANERAVQFFLSDVDQLASLHITNLISGSDELLMATICDSLQNDRFILIQAYCTRADETIFPAEVSVNLIRLSDQDFLNFFIRDVTLRKEAEDRLRSGHAAIQNSGNGIAMTDTQATLLFYNPAMATLLGAGEPDQLDEADITAFLVDPGAGEAIIDTVVQGLTWTGELELECMDESVLFAQASVAPNVNADGEVVGMVWSLLDISDQKRAQQELEERNSQMEEDLALAREFQQAFIQREYPSFPPGCSEEESALGFGHVYLPSGAVGGDFFEIFAVSETRVGIFISDVMGHGVRSALVVATIRGLIEELGPLRYDPASFLSHMNRDLTRIVRLHGHVTFATAFYMVIDLLEGKVTYASAGHPAPFVLSGESNTTEFLRPERDKQGAALGLFAATAFEQTTKHVAPGDTIVLYTDGIFEAESARNCESFEIERVASILEANIDAEPTELLTTVVEQAQAFCERETFDDDVCMVGIKLRKLLADDSGGWAVD
jgi:sigma-B regulation protein RsbU (phosphoserine phosphatase)